ncbi:hypothetical protein ABVT39_008664 [Epinephelus coioides]
MVEVLSVMIKPAAPTQRTADLITGNAKNWGHNTCLILMDHYEAGLEKLLEELKDLLTADWKSAFEVAVRWAKRNLPRITREVINQAEALITATLDIEEVPVQVPQQTGVPAQTQRAPQSTTGDPTPAQIPQPIGVLTQVHRAQPVREGRLTQRVARTTRGVVLTEDNLLQESEFQDPEESRVMEAPIQDSTHIELEALFDELHAEELREEAEARARYTLGPDQVQVHREISPEEEIFQESFDHFTSPEPQRFKQYTRLFNKDLQIDSFPGSHFRHGQALMEKTVVPDDLVVEKIILSFGINSRGNKSKETTVKNLQGAIRSSKRKFPYAEVWVPLINFSSNLPAEEKENLQTLNDHIERNMGFIPLLPQNKFETEEDDIHWTTETASSMFSHWMAFLNSTAL